MIEAPRNVGAITDTARAVARSVHVMVDRRKALESINRFAWEDAEFTEAARELGDLMEDSREAVDIVVNTQLIDKQAQG